jgi:hypothetical protein
MVFFSVALGVVAKNESLLGNVHKGIRAIGWLRVFSDV